MKKNKSLKRTLKKAPKKSSKTAKTAKSAAAALDLSALGEGVWPIERDVFFRPARLKYVRKLIKKEGCVFCEDYQCTVESLCVFKTKYSQIVVNKFPYNSGHLLILPRRHCGDLLQLSQDEYADLMKTLKEAVSAVTAIYNPQGYNIGLNNGSAAGAGIPDHLHFHLVPRWNGDLNFFPLIAETKLVVENSEDTFKTLKDYFSKKYGHQKNMEVK